MNNLNESDLVNNFIIIIHHKIDEIIKVVYTFYQILGFKLYLTSAANLNQLKCKEKKLIDLYIYYMNSSIKILKNINKE